MKLAAEVDGPERQRLCGIGYAVEYAGSAIRDMPIEARLTLQSLGRARRQDGTHCTG